MKKTVSAILLISFLLFFCSNQSLFAAAAMMTKPTTADGSVDMSAPASAWGGLFGWLGWLLVHAAIEPPVAQSKSAILFEDSNAQIDIDYTDFYNRAASFQISKAPTHGNASISQLGNNKAKILYTPGVNFNGADGLEYKIVLADGLTSAPASVILTVQSVNDEPEPQNLNQVFDHKLGHSISFNLGPAQDIDGDNLTYSIVQNLNSDAGTATLNGRAVTVVAGPLCENQVYVLTYSVSDGKSTRVAQINIEMKNCDSIEEDPHHEHEEIGVSLKTHHDTIPNFAHPTNALNRTIIESAQSGNWFSSDTWTGFQVPSANDVVVIKHHVILNGSGDVHAVGIYPEGHLDFARNQNTTLKVVHLQIFKEGHLEIGPIPSQYQAQLIIKDMPINTAIDPHQWGNGLVSVDGKVTIHGAPVQKTFVRLNKEPKAGDMTLELSEPVSGWKDSDPNRTSKVVVSDTRQLTDGDRMESTYASQSEVFDINSISQDGRTLFLKAAVRFAHKGEIVNTPGQPTLVFYPHVALLTRNVVIRSEALSSSTDRYCQPEEFESLDCKTRGHVLLTSRSEADIQYAQFQDLGRTLNKTLNNNLTATTDGVKPNHIGRYTFHMHHVMGADVDNGGMSFIVDGKQYQFVLLGNAMNNSRKWGMTIHGTHYGLVKDNVIAFADGAGMMFEEGSESFNLIDHNFAMGTTGSGRGDERRFINNDLGIEGSAFWFRGPNNYIRNNVAADSKFGYSYWHEGIGTVNIPKGPGKDVHSATGATPTNGNSIPVLEFNNNEAYGLGKGIMLWWLGSMHRGGLTDKDSVLLNYRAWHVGTGIYGYPSSRVVLDSTIMQNDQSKLKSPHAASTGITFGDYFTYRFKTINANIQGFSMGIEMAFYADTDNASGKDAGLMTVEGGYLRNFNNIVVKNPGAPGACPGCPMSEKTALIKNVKFDRIEWAEPGVKAVSIASNTPQNIVMNYHLQSNAVQLVKKDMVLVYDYNRVPGDNFRVFYNEQRPDFVVPKSVRQPNSSVRLWASPVEGKTNAQNWEDYGIAIAGSVMPADAETRPEITGKIKKIFSNTDLDQPILSPVTVSGLGSGQVTLNWTSNENAKHKIVYGPSLTPPSPYDVEGVMDVYANWTPWSSASSKNHSVTLTGLQPATKYDFKVLSLDDAGNLILSQFQVMDQNKNLQILEESSFKTL